MEAWPAPMMSCSDSRIEQNGARPPYLRIVPSSSRRPGEHLVRVGLVADVPQHLVLGRVEQRVDGHRDLARAEVGAEVAADLADRVDDQLAHLLGDLGELRVVEPLEVRGAVDVVEQSGSCLSGEDVVGYPLQRVRSGPSPPPAPRGPRRATRGPARGPDRARTRSRTCACRGARPSRSACRARRRPRSRRGCRRRSGTARRALRQSGRGEVWQVRPLRRGAARTSTDAAISRPVLSSCSRRSPAGVEVAVGGHVEELAADHPAHAGRGGQLARPRRARRPGSPCCSVAARRSASANRPSPARIATSSP